MDEKKRKKKIDEMMKDIRNLSHEERMERAKLLAKTAK